jgi:CRISPR type II-A-associated protein Csn2
VEKVISNVNYPLSYDNSTSLSELIKFVGLKFNFNKSTPLGMLTSYLELLREYTFVSIVFIPYINTILNDSEINELIVFAEKINFYIIGCT